MFHDILHFTKQNLADLYQYQSENSVAVNMLKEIEQPQRNPRIRF